MTPNKKSIFQKSWIWLAAGALTSALAVLSLFNLSHRALAVWSLFVAGVCVARAASMKPQSRSRLPMEISLKKAKAPAPPHQLIKCYGQLEETLERLEKMAGGEATQKAYSNEVKHNWRKRISPELEEIGNQLKTASNKVHSGTVFRRHMLDLVGAAQEYYDELFSGQMSSEVRGQTLQARVKFAHVRARQDLEHLEIPLKTRKA
ncbi:MAG: hypothetical protein AB7F86_02285 [Bdellovibrionales bacterium]